MPTFRHTGGLSATTIFTASIMIQTNKRRSKRRYNDTNKQTKKIKRIRPYEEETNKDGRDELSYSDKDQGLICSDAVLVQFGSSCCPSFSI